METTAQENTAASKALYARAVKFIPGGVNSPVRAFKSVGGDPLFFASANGARMRDADGNEYVDYVGSWGPMILGHAFPAVIEAVQRAAADSLSFGAPCEAEVELAELITKMVPGVERVRMVNSGTEACMSAARVARGYTGKHKIIKFAGCYHGHADFFLIQAGSGAATLGVPSSPGVPPGCSQDTLSATFNDLDSVNALVEANKGEVAAIIVEPVAGNMGCIPPKDGFLQGLRRLCDDEGIVLIFDEVMCGFRVAPGGAQERYGVTADLVTMGKIIGGGMPVGAYGGKAEIMEVVAPTGPVYQAGTLSGNPLAMASGYATLNELHTRPEIYETLEASGAYLEAGFRKALDEAGETYRMNRVGSMISFHFTDQPIENFAAAQGADNARFNRLFHEMLARGVYFPPSAFESLFLSVALTREDLDHTLAAFAESLKAL